MKNDEAARQGRPDTTSNTRPDDSTGSGASELPQWPATPCVPRLVVTVAYEGRVGAVIRCAHGGERQAASMRAWLASDPELAEFCRLACRLRDRMAA